MNAESNQGNNLLEYEEKPLVMRFPAYEAYRQKTKRLIPFQY